MNLDDLLKSIREEDDDSKGAKIDPEKFLKRKTFENPLKGQQFTAPSIPGSVNKPQIKPVIVNIDPEKLVPPSDDKEEKTEVSQQLIKKLDELIQVIKADNDLEEDRQTFETRSLLRTRREEREKRIEKRDPFSAVGNAVGTVKKKFGDIINTVVRFLVFTLLGGLLTFVTNFLKDPKNKKFIEDAQKFLFVDIPEFFRETRRKLQPIIDWFKETIPKVKKFAEDFRLLLARFPFIGQFFATEEEKQKGLPSAPGTFTQPGQGIPLPNVGPGGIPMIIPFATGGLAMGTDTVPALLTPGEFVMSRGAVEMFGADTMMAINKAGGGTNKPKYGLVPGYEGGGAVVKKLPQKGRDFWTLVAVAATEDSDPQAWADVAQSIYNRAASGVYGGGSDIRQIILTPDQYEPTWKHPRVKVERTPNPEWYDITDIESAAIATGQSVSYLQRVADAIQNPKLQEEARRFVGARTDFMGGDENANFAEGDVRRGKKGEDNFFGSFVGPGSRGYAATNPDPAAIPSFVGTQQMVAPPPPVMPAYSTGAMQGPAFGDDQTALEHLKKLNIQRQNEIKKHDNFQFIFNTLRRFLPVSTPNFNSSQNIIVLPTVKQDPANKPSVQANKAPIPEFTVSSGIKMRSLVGKSLGIEDLVT